MFGSSTHRAMKLAKEKGQQFFASESERFSCKLDRILTVYQGYNRIRPQVFPKRLSTVYSADVVVPAGEDGARKDFFHSSTLVGTSSLRRHQRERGLREGQLDTSSKLRIVLPSTAAAQTDSSRARSLVATQQQQPRTKRSRSAGPRTPSKVVLSTPKRIGGGENDILCSSVMLTYREGLFYHERSGTIRNDSDV